MKKLIVLIALAMFAMSAHAEEKGKVKTEAAKAKICKAAKDCKGPLPDICERCGDGRNRCAHWSCSAGKCVTEICPPAPTPAPGTCKTASDCKGILPQICEQCSNGKQECAHFACIAGKCETQICPPDCTAATDCKGPLPQLCEQCSNGKEECAHHVCTAGQCETQICP